jgi:hypothetical protein
VPLVAALAAAVGEGIVTTTTLPQPFPITLGTSADFVFGATVGLVEPAAVLGPVGVFA